MTELTRMTAAELSAALAAGEVSATEVTRAHLDRIAAVDDRVHAFLHVAADSALASAAAVDARRQAGERLGAPARGPVAGKDVFTTVGMPTTCGSRILAGWHPPYDATITQRLKRAGAVILGKTNMDEFAMGSSTENSAFGPSRNPWDLDRIPGGSSGGSAAVVAADEALAALGSDTGGSIRQPAALCGCVGVKPTYGRVSRYGLVAFASSLDQIGPLTKDVRDAALLMNIISGYDERDSTSVNEPVPDYTKSLVNDVRGLKIGIPKEAFVEGLDPEVRRCVEDALALLKKQGAIIKEVSLPHTPYAVATYYIVATAEASSNLARFDGVRYGLRVQPTAVRKNALVDMYEETRAKGFGDE